MNIISIGFDNLTVKATLNDSPTASEIWSQLPIEARTNTWGDEIFFEIPVNIPQEPDAREQVEIGELGYWPVGRAFCIFFGPTPVSTDEKPRAYSPVNIIGEVLGDFSQLSSIQDGERVRIAQMDRD
jgi:hypothetical protein